MRSGFYSSGGAPARFATLLVGAATRRAEVRLRAVWPPIGGGVHCTRQSGQSLVVVPTRRGVAQKAKESVNGAAVVKNRVKAAYERFKERKAEMLMLYGSTFVVVHEVLGIASYAITYFLLASGVLDVEHFAGLVGFTEEDGTLGLQAHACTSFAPPPHPLIAAC